MFAIFRTASVLLVVMTLVTGVAYPLAVTVVAQVAFSHAANGSLIRQPVKSQQRDLSIESTKSAVSRTASGLSSGSELIGQTFSDPGHFWGRPSATSPLSYHAMGGSGTNMATTNPALVQAVRDRIAKLREADPGNMDPVPVDLVTSSGSGLDPHISEAAAQYQANRVARVRNLNAEKVREMILAQTERPTAGILGQGRVNVLKLNLALDAMATPQ